MSIDAVVHATAAPVSGDVFRETLGLDVDGGVISGGNQWQGTGVRVALVDSGLDPEKDLQRDRVLAFFDFTRPADKAVRPTNPKDDYGHGTHVAGLIGGTGDESDDEYQGPAQDADFIVFRVLNNEGAGYTSDVLAAIDYAVQQNATFGIDVMNLSLGHPIFEPAATDPLVQAVEAAVASGIVVVTSAGNIGINPDHRRGRLRRDHVARERPGGDHRRGARPALHRHALRRPRSGPTARAGRPGMTPSPSRTWWRRGINSPRSPRARARCIRRTPPCRSRGTTRIRRATSA